MNTDLNAKRQQLPNGVMLNAYPDSIGGKLSDAVNLLKRDELKDTFSQFYILPTFFNSDLDRGFSIIDYDFNKALVSKRDLEELEKLNIFNKPGTSRYLERLKQIANGYGLIILPEIHS